MQHGVTSVEETGSNDIPKLNYVLDPAGFVNQNVRREITLLPKSIFANAPINYKAKETHPTEYRITKIAPISEPQPQYSKPKKIKHDINLLTTTGVTLDKKTTYKKIGRQGNNIKTKTYVSKNNSPNTSNKVVYVPTVAYNDHITQYHEIEVTLNNKKMKTNLKTVKDILSSNRQKRTKDLIGKIEEDEDYYGSPFSEEDMKNSRITKMHLDYPIKNNLNKHHPKLETDKDISKLNENYVKNIERLYRLETGKNKNDSKENNVSIKTLQYKNHPTPQINKSTSEANVQGTQTTVTFLGNKFHNPIRFGNVNFDKFKKTIRNDHKNKPIEPMESNRASEKVFHVTSINNPNINKDNADADYDLMANIRRKTTTMEFDYGNGVPSIATDSVNATEILAPITFHESNKKNLKNQNNMKQNSKKDRIKTAKVIHGEDNHRDIKEVMHEEDKPSNVKQVMHEGDNHRDVKKGIHEEDNHSDVKKDMHQEDNHSDVKQVMHEEDNHRDVKKVLHEEDSNSNVKQIMHKELNHSEVKKVIREEDNIRDVQKVIHEKDNHSDVKKVVHRENIHHGRKKVKHEEDNNNVKLQKVKDYDGEENIDDGKKINEVYTIIVTDEGKIKTENINSPNGIELTMNLFEPSEGKPIARKAFKKCLNKKARKICIKSCNTAYKNVCTRLTCTSRSKRALKKECKKSCTKSFGSSKYSDEDSDESCSDDSNSS